MWSRGGKTQLYNLKFAISQQLWESSFLSTLQLWVVSPERKIKTNEDRMLLSCYWVDPPAHHVFVSGLLLRLNHQSFPGKPSQSELETGLIVADGRGVKQLLELLELLPGVVQVRFGFQVVKVSEGREFLQQQIFMNTADCRYLSSYLYHGTIAGNFVVANFQVSDRNVLHARHVQHHQVNIQKIVVLEGKLGSSNFRVFYWRRICIEDRNEINKTGKV